MKGLRVTKTDEIERLTMALEAAQERAATAEYRLFTYRRDRSATSRALADFIKDRARTCASIMPR
jgi:hypothetical protein